MKQVDYTVSSPQGTVDAILMASGFSSRFGNADKLLAPFRGKPLACHTLELVCGLPCFGRVFFVWGRPQVARLAQGFPVELIENPHPEYGSGESARLGVSASGAAHYMFFPCDQPLLDTATLTGLLALRQPGRIVVPFHSGCPGSPALFSALFREELLALQPGQLPRIIKKRHPESVVTLPVVNGLVLADIDTPGQLKDLESASPLPSATGPQ